MYPESELLPISALQHLMFCRRQCALIHIERAWEENLFTAEGRIMHEHVHTQGHETRKLLRTEFSVSIRSLRLGLIGQADVVEFREDGIFPIEYKRGRAKEENWDKIQLCAQAMCLEEMLGKSILSGALFYGKTKRRQEVPFDFSLRQETEKAAQDLHSLIQKGENPRPEYSSRCESCSLMTICMPKIKKSSQTVGDYLDRMLKEP